MRCSSSQSLMAKSHGDLMYFIQFLHPLYTARRRIAAPTTFPRLLSDTAFHFSIGVCVQTIKHFPGVSHVILRAFWKWIFFPVVIVLWKKGFCCTSATETTPLLSFWWLWIPLFTCSFHQLVPLLWSVNIRYSPVLVFSDPKVSAIIQTRGTRNRKFILYFRKCIFYTCTRLYQKDSIVLFLFCLPQESDYATKLFFSEYYNIWASCCISWALDILVCVENKLLSGTLS